MDNELYFPNAFFAFQSNILKCDARQIMAPIVMKSLGLYDKKASTPWKISLYHIDEFETNTIREMPEVIRKLKLINGRIMSKPLEVTCMSSYDITLTQRDAKTLLENNPNTQKVVNTAKDMQLNYIIHGAYIDSSSMRFNYNDDDKAYQKLKIIAAQLENTKISMISNNFKKQFYAYKDIDEFKVIFP